MLGQMSYTRTIEASLQQHKQEVAVLKQQQQQGTSNGAHLEVILQLQTALTALQDRSTERAAEQSRLVGAVLLVPVLKLWVGLGF